MFGRGGLGSKRLTERREAQLAIWRAIASQVKTPSIADLADALAPQVDEEALADAVQWIIDQLKCDELPETATSGELRFLSTDEHLYLWMANAAIPGWKMVLTEDDVE